jgi:hypothetical protein
LPIGAALLSLPHMLASIFNLIDPAFLISSPVWLALGIFWVWMLVDAIRQREWLWVLFLVIGSGFSAFLYYLLVYRASYLTTRGFELPGTIKRQQIKQLQSQIHHLDKAHHHSQLGDIYFQLGKVELAEASYRAAMERDPTDIDTRAHFGQCLLRQKRPAEARPLLEGVVREKPEHDYGFSKMALAETLTALDETDEALRIWKQVTENHSYPRAKVQLAELYAAKGQPDLARAELKEVLEDDPHTPAFQRRRDRVWVKRARALMRRI